MDQGGASDPLAVSGRVDPYFHARRIGDQVEVQGRKACFLGHRIPRHVPPDDGIFAEWAWDGRALSVSNDRYGMYPLYYFISDDEMAVSPSIATLLWLGAPRDLDEDALAVFVRLGYFIGEDTPFRAIRSMPPRGTLSWRARAGSTISSIFPSVRPQAISRAAAIEGYIWHFREAIARRPAPESGAVVPLSGGRDSRHILLELVTSGRPPRLCVTTRHNPPRDNADLAVAGKLADRLRLLHIVLKQPPSQLKAEVRKNRLTGSILAAYPEHADIPFLAKGGRVDDRGHIRRLSRETAWFAARHGTGRLIDRGRIVPRLLRGSLRGDHRVTDALQVPMIVDLLQIEQVADGG